jgi:hypothetical protein
MINFIIKSLILYFVSLEEITFDEAYYWCYSNRLQLSYCSKPPMIGFILNIVNRIKNIRNVKLIRIISFVINTLSFIISNYLIGPIYTNFIFNTNASYFSRFFYCTDLFVNLFQIINMYFFKNNMYYYLIFSNTLLLYSKQIGFLNFLLFYKPTLEYFIFLIFSLILITPMLFNDYKKKGMLTNHTLSSNISNNIKINLLQPFKFILDQVIFFGLVNSLFLFSNYNKLSNYKYIFVSLFFASFFKRININWSWLIFLTTTIDSDVEYKVNNYDFYIYIIICLIYKFYPFKIKRKYKDYQKLSLDILKILSNNDIDDICYISCRKLGSYLWFYTNIMPVKLKKQKHPICQFDIWSKDVKVGEKYLLITYEHDNISNLKIDVIKKFKLKYEYSEFNLYIFNYVE